MTDADRTTGDTDRNARDALIDTTAFLCGEQELRVSLDFVVARCVELSDVAAGIMVSSAPGVGPTPFNASGEPVRLLQDAGHLFAEGPAHETCATGNRTDCPNLTAEEDRWPRFAPVARELGFAAVHTVPMSLHSTVVGVLTVAAAQPDLLTEDDLGATQALANLGSLGFGTYWARQSSELVGQLESALHSRVRIEQAKGVVAERLNVSIDEAFELLRAQARRSRRKLGDIATAVIASRGEGI